MVSEESVRFGTTLLLQLVIGFHNYRPCMLLTETGIFMYLVVLVSWGEIKWFLTFHGLM